MFTEERRSKQAVEKVTDDLVEVELTFSAIFFQNSVEHVLGTTQDNLANEQCLDMVKAAVHLDTWQIFVLFEVFLNLWKLLNDLAEVSHVKTSLVEEICQAC